MSMKRNRFKKRIATMMTVMTLAVWFALPNVAHAETLIIEGRHIYTSIAVSENSATATITYTEGSGQIWAAVEGEASNNIISTMVRIVSGPRNTNSTPGGVSSSVEAPSGWHFYAANAVFEYELPINGTTYKGKIPERKGV